jgi:hypothetical protein
MSSPLIPPRTDEDTFAVLDDALAALAGRRGAWLGDEHAVIGLLASLIDQALRALPEAVATARANGASWNDIAILTGISAEEARLRFDPDSPIADGRWPWPTDDR